MASNSQYVEQYAEYAMEQMRRYGIPASVTLAQGILESSNGKSQLAQNENNHFGIKATQSWINNGGAYGVYSDDNPNDKFRSYASVGDSYEDHSRFLANNDRYRKCFSYSPDDYKRWTVGLQNAGYATGGNYAAKLQKIIESNNLQQYDQMVMQQMKSQGRSFGVANNPRQGDSNAAAANTVSTGAQQGQYSFPLERESYLFVTSPYGNRKDPINPGRTQFHKGIDIRCKGDNILATENGGRVIKTNDNVHTNGGKSVTVEYARADGSKVQCTYMHLSKINCKVGDSVTAGQALGVTGNTGARSTGEHLHFGVKLVGADGKSRDYDPSAYLAEIAERGNIQKQVMHNGHNLLAKYKVGGVTPQDTKSPNDWLKMLTSSQDSGLDMGGDIFSTILSGMLMVMIKQMSNKSDDEQKQVISDAVANKSVDLTPMVQGVKSCTYAQVDGKSVLTIDNGERTISHTMTASEQSRLAAVLNDGNVSDEQKKSTLTNIVNGIVVSEAMSNNYESNRAQSQGNEVTIQR